MSRRVITISRKKWGKSAAKTERIVRDAIIKADTESSIEEYLQKAKSVTSYDLANRFNIRISIARKILREKEAEGVVVPYIREGGFVVYTTPAEIEKREGGAPIMVADALEEVASSVPRKTVITEEMDIALVAAGTPGVVKPSRLARKRREAGAKKERKDERPEVIVEPLAPQPEATPEETPKKKVPAKKKTAPKKKAPAKKKAAPKKKAPAKKKAEEKKPVKKPTTKKKAEKKTAPKKIAAPKKAPTKKKAEPKAAPKKKTATKKKAEEKAAPKKKAPAKKKASAKKPVKKTTTKKAAEKKPAKKKE